MERTAIIGGRRTAGRIVSHEVWHDHPNAAFFVIEHDWRATVRTGAQFQWPVRVLSIEGLVVQAIMVINGEVAVIEKHHMRCALHGDTLAG